MGYKQIFDHEACYWINAGWNDYHKGISEPEHGRYGKEERMFALLGFERAKAGYPKIRTEVDA